MKKYTFTENGIVYERIDKKKARSAYVGGLPIKVYPANLCPAPPIYTLNRKNREQFTDDEIGVKNDFNALVQSFEFYNCCNAWTGKYAAFYIAKEAK